MIQQEKARMLHLAHQQDTLVLPNAWDAASASIIENAGAKVIGSSSAAVAWSCGLSDGQVISRQRMLQTLREIVSATTCPVSADIESGYGSGSTEDVRKTVFAMLKAGIVGINIEDTPGRNEALILQPQVQAERIRVARTVAIETQIDLFINARTDLYLAGIGTPENRLTETIHRALTYLEAGADGIFVPGLADLSTIEKLVKAIDAPLNIMVGPGSPSVSALKDVGVARISTGPSIALAAFGCIRQAAQEILSDGTYHRCEGSLTFQELNNRFVDVN